MLRNTTLCFALILSTLFLSGCAQQLTHAILKSGLPSYQELMSTLPKLSDNYGRVIVFYQHHALNPIATVQFKFDDYPYSCLIYNDTFQYDDLPTGKHLIYAEFEKNKSVSLPFDVHSGEMLYVEISDNANAVEEIVRGGSLGPLSIKLDDKQTALKILSDSNYFFKKPMSCLTQQLQNVYGP